MRCETYNGSFRISDLNLVEKFKELLRELDVSEEDRNKVANLFEAFANADLGEKFEKALEIYSDETFIRIIVEPLGDFGFRSEYLRKFAKTLRTIQQKYARIYDIARDNMIHQIQVFLVGCYFLHESKDFWYNYIKSEIELNLKRIIEIDFECEEKYFEKVEVIERYYFPEINFKHIFSIWAICSLYHDLGKIFEDLYKYARNTNEILGLIGDTLGIPIDFNSRSIFDEIKTFRPLRECKDKFLELLEIQYGNDSEEYRILRSISEHDFEHLKHGFYSALLIIQASRTIFQEDNVQLSISIQGLFTQSLFLSSLIAMSLHIYKETYIFGALTQLLIIADNVQEWQRATKFYYHRFVMFMDEVWVKREKENHNGIEYLVYCVKIEHKLDKNSIRQQDGEEYRKVPDNIKDAIETIFYEYTKPKKRYEGWSGDFNNLLKYLKKKLDLDVSKELLFDLFLGKTIDESKKAVGLAITLIHEGNNTKVLYICGRCHESKHYEDSEVEFRCDRCD
jgi:hypothetical protein